MDRRYFLKSAGTASALWLMAIMTHRALARDQAGFDVDSTFAATAPWPGQYKPGVPLPQVLQEIYPARFGEDLVIAGGFSGFGPLPYPVASSYWFNLKQQRWREGPELPHRLHHPYLVAHKGQLRALGGYRFSYFNPWQMQSRCYVLNDFDGQWQAATSLPDRRAEFAAGSTDSGLIVTGGRKPRDSAAGGANGQYEDHTNAKDTWIWDGERWLSGAPIPTARNSVGSAVVNNRLHVIGGRRVLGSGLQQNRAEHQVYDPETDTWESRAPLPLPQAGCAAAVFDNAVYVFGGEVFTEPRRVFANAWRYDLITDQWHALSNMPTPVHGHGAVASQYGIHLLGGGEAVSAAKTSNQHTIYRPDGMTP